MRTKCKLKIIILSAALATVAASAVNVFAQSYNISDTITEGCSEVLAISDTFNTVIAESKSSEEAFSENGYPDGYDPDDPVAMGEVDPWEVYQEMQSEEMDRAMLEEAQRAWEEYNEPLPPDVSDGIIKP